MSEAGCRSVPAGRWPSACRRGLQASPILRGSPTEGGRRLSEPAYPGRGVPLATHPLWSARCDTPLGVRVWLSQTAPRSHATPPCAWLPPFALREVLFRSATYPPLRRRGAMGPVAALLPNAPGFQPNARYAWCRTGTQTWDPTRIGSSGALAQRLANLPANCVTPSNMGDHSPLGSSGA